MKLLILSFFGTLLIYSFFFDKEENKGNQDLRLRPDSVNYDMAYAIAYNQIPYVQRHVVTDYLFKYILRDFHGWSFVLHNHLRLQ